MIIRFDFMVPHFFSVFAFLGRPRGRTLDSRPSWTMMRRVQDSPPKGRPPLIPNACFQVRTFFLAA